MISWSAICMSITEVTVYDFFKRSQSVKTWVTALLDIVMHIAALGHDPTNIENCGGQESLRKGLVVVCSLKIGSTEF
jgi:hypothetical protein